MRKVFVSITGALVLMVLLAGVASAVPCGPTTCAPFSIAPVGSNVLLVRPHGMDGSLLAYNATTGKTLANLTGGVVTADGRRVVATTFVPSGNGTRVVRYDTRSGAQRSSWIAPGATSQVAAVSASGRFAALVAGTASPTITIADLDRRQVLRTVQLQGNWRVDALSRDGSRLYLLETLPNGDYRVRVDVAGRGLLPDAITDPAEAEPMTGFPWSSIATADGRWQLTLFVKSTENKNEAFIHALSLDGATAKCIDLSSGAFMAIGRYALVLSPNGRTLYAANPSLGVVSVVDLATRSVTSTIHFRSTAADDRSSTAFGAISRDGRTVYFSAGRGLHAFDTRSRTVQRLAYRGDITGLGVGGSGRTLLVVRALDDQGLRLDARTGTALTA